MPSISTNGDGELDGVLDVCKKPNPPGPAIPMPFQSNGKLKQANPGTASKKVKILNKAVVLLKTVIMMTSKMEQGVLGGVVSGMIKGPAQFKKGSEKVTVEESPPAFHTCIAGMNGSNPNVPAGIHSKASQNKVDLKM